MAAILEAKFQIHFRDRNLLHFDSNITEVYSSWSDINKSAFVHVKVWWQKKWQNIIWTKLTKTSDDIWCHKATMS